MNLVIKACVPVVAIFGLVGLDVVALCHGIDGIALTATVAAVAGIGGYTVKGIDFAKVVDTLKEMRRAK